MAQKSLNGKFTSKIDFSVADVDIKSLQFIHRILNAYLDHEQVKFEQNRMVRTIQNF